MTHESLEYERIFSAGELFTAHAVLSYGVRTGQDLTGLLAYLGYVVDEDMGLVPADDLLGKY
jgi:hypothetical protein